MAKGGFLRGLFGGGEKRRPPDPPPPSPPGPPREPPEDPQVEARLRASAEARTAFWRSVGDLDGDVMGHLISPQFLGGAAWPTTRQAYCLIRRPHTVIVASDGMSDPFDDGRAPVNGFGMELFIETPNLAAPAGAGVEPLRGSWALELLEHFCGVVAGAGGVTGQLDAYGALSTESPGVSRSPTLTAQIPRRFVTADDSLGLLIGQPAPDFPHEIPGMPLSPVRACPLVLLTAAELEAIRAGGSTTRTDIVGRLAALPSRHRSDFERQSVV